LLAGQAWIGERGLSLMGKGLRHTWTGVSNQDDACPRVARSFEKVTPIHDESVAMMV